MPSKIDDIIIPESVLSIPRDYDGYVFVSDIDRTYLMTEIDSLGGLLRAAFESPERKNNVPGFSILLRALRRGGSETPQKNPLFFLSASPPQMESKLRAKMSYDGVDHDGIILKNQLQYVKKAQFKKLKEQIGYKLGALLSLWYYLPHQSKLIFFGDDSESDALIFTLFSEIVAGNYKPREILTLLKFFGVYRHEAMKIAWLSRNIHKPAFPLHAAFINLDAASISPSFFTKLSPFICPTDNTLQAAFSLWEMGLIRERAIRSIGRDLIYHFDMTPKELLRSLLIGAKRQYYQLESILKLWNMLYEANVLPEPPENSNLNSISQNEKFIPRRWGAHVQRKTIQELKNLFES